jgi:tetratricopeptide (TPR) repeat protein
VIAGAAWLAIASGMQGVAAGADDSSPTSPPAATQELAQGELQARLESLVAELGADEYFVREKAQRELQRLGIVAFDAVYAAIEHDDIEIAHRAKYLVATIEVDWVEDRDSEAVKTILSRYEESPTEEREKMAIKLSGLPAAEAMEPLSRIARFEPSESLSRRSVLQLMDLTSAKNLDEDQRIEAGRRLALLSGSGKRPSSRWLAAHAATLQDPQANVDAWEPLIQEDLDLYHRRPELTDPNVVAELLQRHGEILLTLDRTEEAYESLRRLFQVIPSQDASVLVTVRWLVERQAWPVVLDAESRYAALFEQNVGLAYCAAEAHAALGDDEAVAKLLERIENDPGIDPPQRIDIAGELESWGRFDWAEREYRLGLKELQPPNPAFAWASRRLAEMLHDQQRDVEAAEALTPYLKALEENEQFRSILEDQFEWPVKEHRARYATFRGMALEAEGKLAEAREAYEKGFEDYEYDADLLIAMHRTPDAPEEWRAKTKARIEAAQTHFKAEIAAARQEVEAASRSGNIEAARGQLALSCNQYSWLVGNTFGDFDDAVRRSEESLEIRQGNSGYLDTLARALFARGDVEEAIRRQRQALESDRHSGALNRQLREFEAAAAKKP